MEANGRDFPPFEEHPNDFSSFLPPNRRETRLLFRRGRFSQRAKIKVSRERIPISPLVLLTSLSLSLRNEIESETRSARKTFSPRSALSLVPTVIRVRRLSFSDRNSFGFSFHKAKKKEKKIEVFSGGVRISITGNGACNCCSQENSLENLGKFEAHCAFPCRKFLQDKQKNSKCERRREKKEEKYINKENCELKRRKTQIVFGATPRNERHKRNTKFLGFSLEEKKAREKEKRFRFIVSNL
jgi:hypothetical protein